jgi:hypothetical protein
MFAGVTPDVFSKQTKKKRRKEATLEKLAETSSSDGRSAAEVGTLAQNDTPPCNKESCMVTPSTTPRKSHSTMDPVLTQVKSVTSKTYHERFQSTIGMAIPVGQLPKWFRNDTDIGDDEIKSTFTKLTEALSVNTAEKKRFLSFSPHDG